MADSYTVVAGDTLSEIAAKHGLTVDQLVEWNDIEDPSLIKVGQTIVLSDPKASEGGMAYTVVAGDTFSEIGQRFGVDYRQIMEVNGYEDPTKLRVGSTITIPYRTHTVVAGDTFSEIGQKFGVDYRQIMKLNGYEDPTKLRVGATLQIPFAS